jgi:hypothetical protein
MFKRTPIPSVHNFRRDPLFPRIERAVAAILAKSKVVTPIGVLVGMDLLKLSDVDDWRRGRIPYLEKAIQGNLKKLGRILRILRFHSHDLNLKASSTVYMRYGRGPRCRLRFSKTGDPNVEEAYMRHFIWPDKKPFHQPTKPTGTAEAPAPPETIHNLSILKNGQIDSCIFTQELKRN